MYGLHQLDITTLPFVASQMLGISEYAGGVFCSLVLFSALALPTTYLIQGKAGLGLVLIEGILLIGFCTAIGWIDVLWAILMILITASLMAYKLAEVGKSS